MGQVVSQPFCAGFYGDDAAFFPEAVVRGFVEEVYSWGWGAGVGSVDEVEFYVFVFKVSAEGGCGGRLVG